MITFANAALLAGLAAIVIPPIIHLFHRRRIDEHDWAAMQFLTVSQRTRRKISIEQFLLMLLRMLAIAMLALALAAPVMTSTWFNRLGLPGGSRDVVLLIDGSASMACKVGTDSAHEAAKAWAARFLETLRPGDRVAIYEARQQTTPLLPQFTTDLTQPRNALELLPPPRGSVDWPACVAAASKLLESGRQERDIVIITDGQRSGWADDATLPRWGLGGHGGAMGRPRIWVATVGDHRAEPFNLALEPIIAARGVAAADREIRFRSALRVSGPGPPIVSVKLEIDGRPNGEIKLEGAPGDPVRGLKFSQKFSAGSHLVTLKCAGDDFAEDNRQDYALEVLPAIPVLIVTGAPGRRADFLRDALAPPKDPSPAFRIRMIPTAEFNAGALTSSLNGLNFAPRVVVLANVERLTNDQNAAVEAYLAEGGSVLVTLGDQVDAEAWNRISFRGGRGWLPARIVEMISSAASPLPESFVHPAVEVFREPLPGGLQTAIFPQHWKLDLEAGINGVTATAIMRLTDRDPLLAERGIGRGRVVISAVPLDNSWGTNLVTLPDFVRLSHELIYYLAGAKSASRNLAPGQPLVFSPQPPENPAGVTVTTPDGATRTVPVPQWPLIFNSTRESGPYTLTTAGGQRHYFAVRSDSQESLLTPCNDDDRARVAQVVPGMNYINDPNEILAARSEGPQSRDLWWLFLLGVIAVLLLELLYTRRLARGVT